MRWAVALLRRRPGRLLASAAGTAVAVALLGSLGAFIASSKAQMTRRSVAQVPVDWQVEAQPGADPAPILRALRDRPGVRVALPIELATTTGFEATSGGTTQSTGPGVVVGVPPGYLHTFPNEVRTLAGSFDGVLLAQQTAANLHAAPGDLITIGRAGLPPVQIVVAGIVDLPAADSLFQRVGAAPGAQATAPPDNVLLVPDARWHTSFDSLASARPDLVRHQVHVRLAHTLPPDPAAAYGRITGAAHRFESDLAGAALVGDNLGATLDTARQDALYAQVLFLLLGIPGAAVAALLVYAVTGANRERRRRELALIKLRGGSVRQLQSLVVAEAVLTGAVGSAVGVVAALVVGRVMFKSSALGATSSQAIAWALASAIVGLAIALVAVVGSTRRDVRATTIAHARAVVGRRPRPLALRLGLDIALLVSAGVVFWVTGRSKYALVLAPEGVPTVSVSYWALAGPLLLWAGTGLFAWRASETILRRVRRPLRAALSPIAGRITTPVVASVRRRGRRLATCIVLLALTIAFAVSTAVFNTTYRQQVEVDALLTNGADVTVTYGPTVPAPADMATRLSAVPGAGHVEAMQHRYVYVGNDLQDLYGVDSATIGTSGKLQDAYFSGGSASELLGRLARQPDAALVSDETVHDFQLTIGDRLRLRIRDGRGAAKVVDFQFAGVVREFPTAPSDSFVVANATYIASATGDPASNTFLIASHGSPRTLAERARHVVGTDATVSDIDGSRRVVGSSLTAVDLAGLTRVELGFALVLAAAVTFLVLGGDLAERRRSNAIVSALGAAPRQVAAFARADALVVAVFGGGLGALGGWTLSHMLVKVLTGVFDPPPAHLATPWSYLAVLALTMVGGLTAATQLVLRSTRRPLGEELRSL